MKRSGDRVIARDRVIELKDNDIVWFQPMHPKFGHAEFTVCPVWRRRQLFGPVLLKEVWIERAQQEVSGVYRLSVPNFYGENFGLGSWSRLIDLPNMWVCAWCEVHRCLSMRIYVPLKSNYFEVLTGSNTRIMFGFREEPRT